MSFASSSMLPALALFFNATVWGLTWIGFKALNQQGLHPLWTTVLVYLCMLAVLLVTKPSGWRGLRQHPWLLWLALAAGGTNICFNWAATVGDVMRVVLLFYLMPLWSTGLAWWLLGERPTAAALLRLTLSLMGVALVLWQPGAAGDAVALPRLADGLALLAGFFFALTNVLLRRWRKTPTDARMTAMFSGGLALSAVLAPTLAGGLGALPAGGLWLLWAGLLALAILSANLALQYGAAHLPAQTTAMIMMSEVLIASASAIALGDADPRPATLGGGALILIAAWLAVRQRQ